MDTQVQISGEQLWQWRRVALGELGLEPGLAKELDLLLQAYTDLDSLALRLETYKTRAQISLGCSFTHLQQLWQQRVQARVPLQYLIGQTAWRDFNLQVSPAVLIPRPETESLVDLAVLAQAQINLPNPHWADLGTGSAAIAIGMALALPEAIIYGVDASPAALAVAEKNVAAQGLAERIHLYQGSWLAPLGDLRGKLAGIVANPPYIPTAMVADLQPEVVGHEPHLALDGGPDGLDCLREIIATAPDYLIAGGVLLLEMMEGQAQAVTELLQATGAYTQIQIHPDLSGIERFAWACRRSG